MSSPSTGQPNEIKSSDNETGDIGQQVPEQDNLEEEVITLEQTAVNQDAAAVNQDTAAVNQDTAAVNQDTDEVQHQKTIDVNKFINKLRGATNPNVRLTDEQFLEILQHEPEVQYNDGPAIKQNIFQVLLSKPKALEAFVRCGLNILNQLEDSAEIKRSIKKQFAEKLLAFFNTEGDRYTSLANKSEFSCINTLMDAVEQMNKEVMDAVDPMIAPGNQPDTEIMPAVKPGKEIMPAVLGFITSKNVDAGLELLDRLRGNDSLDKFLQDNVEAFGELFNKTRRFWNTFLENDFSTLSPFANDYIVSIGNRNPSNMQVNNILKLIAKGDVSEDNNLEVFQNALERVTDVNQSLEGNEPTPLFTQLLSNFTKEANILFLKD